MRQHFRLILPCVALLATAVAGGCGTPPGPVHPAMKAVGYGAAVHARGAIACVHPLAARAAIEAYEKGGNAIDAAVAAALTLGVVDGHNSGIGGGCFVLIRKGDGTILAIDGRETAPAGATAAMFVRGGKADTALSQTGALAIGIPGSLAAYEHALKSAGRLALADLLRPAADLAEGGFVFDANCVARLRSVAPQLAMFEASRAILLDPQGRPWPKGHTLRQPDLAATYRAIARQGIEFFYRGAFARAVEAWMKDHGGVVTAKDFGDYRVTLREPIITPYRRFTIIGFPPPSSGGVHVAQMLGMLGHADLAAVNHQAPANRLHLIAQAMKLAFADRAHWLGDPDFTPVPRGLIDKEYAASLFKQIDPDRATPVDGPGRPPAALSDTFGKHTTHIAAVDAEGNWVAITATVNTTFGSKVIIPGTGVVMNNQMDDFAIEPGVPNAFQLLGADANAVAPRKRPLSSMTPTIVLEGERPVLTLGAAGGPTIITAVVCTLVDVLDLGMPLDAAVAAPRIHHQWRPDELRIERSAGADMIARLRAMGHSVREANQIAVLQAIGVDEKGAIIAVTDPRLGTGSQ